MDAEDRSLWAQIVDALNGIYGAHSGHRGVHAKGTLCSGTFTATPQASKLTRAPHMQGQPVRTHVRFSNASGNPGARDTSSDSRGMAVKFYLEDASTTDISAVTIPVFVARTPEDFLELTLARQPKEDTGEIDMEKIGAFLQAHPEAVPAVEAAMLAQPPVSYARCTYFAVHAFKFVDPDGGSRWIRYRWEPEAGEAWLEKDEAKKLDPEHLTDELQERFADGSATFLLWAQIAGDSDPIDDPTAAWPSEREQVELGRLEVTGLATDRERDGDVLVFDPTRVPDGIEPSNDRILHARPHAYSESVFRRAGVRREN
ncbi:MAG TPA: catalase family peroxidase [Actinomycetota bacterium]|nr:catalase family peroxidase [Actinomycetota bacterium]